MSGEWRRGESLIFIRHDSGRGYNETVEPAPDMTTKVFDTTLHHFVNCIRIERP